jgi:hypothetical protein
MEKRNSKFSPNIHLFTIAFFTVHVKIGLTQNMYTIERFIFAITLISGGVRLGRLESHNENLEKAYSRMKENSRTLLWEKANGKN